MSKPKMDDHKIKTLRLKRELAAIQQEYQDLARLDKKRRAAEEAVAEFRRDWVRTFHSWKYAPSLGHEFQLSNTFLNARMHIVSYQLDFAEEDLANRSQGAQHGR